MAFRDPVQETDLSSGVCIVAPVGEAYQAAAEPLRVSLEQAISSPVDVLPDDTQAIGGRHVVALGNMMDSAFLRGLYFRAYDLTDYAWPGPGGWALRTAPHSVAGTGHVIVAGVSQAADAPDAAKTLTEEIDAAGAILPYLHRVHPGRWGDVYLKPAQERLEKGDAALEREFTSGPGDWTYMWAIADIGVLAVQTGHERLMEMFFRQVCQFARTRWFERHLPDPPQIHGFLRTMLLPFAMLENHPGISRALREEALEAFLGLYRSKEGAGNAGFLNYVGVDQVRQNHQTMSGLDLYYGGRYFGQAHGLAEGLSWMKLAEVFFAPQMRSNKPVCDSWGHQWAFSLFNTADFALAAGKMAYFSSDAFLEGVDRALMAHSHLEGGPLQYFLMAAAVTGNDEYLQLCRVSDREDLVRRAIRKNVEPLRTWVTGRAAVEPRRLGRVRTAPLSRLFYDSIEDFAGFAPKGVYVRDTPFEQAFDKIFFRSGWTDGDDYLLLDGISGGSHSYQDGNCIVRYTSYGKNWFGGRVGFGPASVREHMGVSVVADGSGSGCESRYASLRYLEEGAQFSVAGTAMHYPGQATWFRHVVHSKDRWFLVVDEVQASRDGAFLIEARWHVVGDVVCENGALVSTQEDVRLTVRHTGSAVQALSPFVYASAKGGTHWVQRSLAHLNRGEGMRFATLFWADEAGRFRSYSLLNERDRYRIEMEGQRISVSLSENRETPDIRTDDIALPSFGRVVDATDKAPFQIRKGEVKPVWRGACEGQVTSIGVEKSGCCAGDDQGGISVFDPQGNRRWSQKVPGAIRAVSMLPDGGVVAGGDGQTIYRFDASGEEIWSRHLEWQPMNWDYWTRMNVQVVSLAVGDFNGDGKPEVFAGCADRHIYAFNDAGDLLWRSACQWGPPVCLGLSRLRDGIENQVLAGMADPSIHGCIRVYDAKGNCIQTLQRPDIMSWSIPSWSVCIRVADIDGDGWDEALSGVDTNHRQLIVYHRDGKIMWEADLGGAVTALEAAVGRVYAGAANGFLQSFAADGRRLWSRFLSAPVVGLAPERSGGCLAALCDGRVVAVDETGGIASAGQFETAAITAAAWASAWQKQGLLVGCETGLLAHYI